MKFMATYNKSASSHVKIRKTLYCVFERKAVTMHRLCWPQLPDDFKGLHKRHSGEERHNVETHRRVLCYDS